MVRKTSDPIEELLDGWRTLSGWQQQASNGDGPGYRVHNRLVDRLTAVAEKALLDPAVVQRLIPVAQTDPDPDIRARARHWLEPEVPLPGLPLEPWLRHPLVRLNHVDVDPALGVAIVPESMYTPDDVLSGSRGPHTWLLGAPLDSGQAWPTRCDGLPLAHLAQVQLGDPEHRHEDWRAPLPEEGVLQFFYDLEASGDDPGEATERRWLVRHVRRPASDLLPVPNDLGDAYRPGQSARQHLTWTFPSPLDLDLKDDEFERADRLHEHVMRTVSGSGQQRAIGDPVGNFPLLLGHSQLSRGEAVERLAEMLPTPDPGDYTLLIDIPGEGPYDGWFGDVGHVEFWIRNQDLHAGRFEKAWLLLRY